MEEKKESKHEHHDNILGDVLPKKKNDWKILSAILGIVIIILLAYLIYSKSGFNSISGETAGNKLVEYLNTKTGGGVEYLGAEDMGGNLYAVSVTYQGQTIPVYITKDGKYFVQGAIPMDETAATADPTQTQQPANVPKNDKPVAELFVMTHCPYGTQAEKGFIPAIKNLGTKADAKIRFVHYFMHGDKEEKETYNQVCIREEQNAKYLDYLSCFLASTGTEADSTKCLDTAKIDKAKLTACLANNNTKAKQYYTIDKQLSEKYGVQGSPTLVINGAQADSGRDAKSMSATICNAFNTAPAECSAQLSSAAPSPGFGTGTGTATDATC